MGARTRRWRRALEVTRVAQRSGMLGILREVGVAASAPQRAKPRSSSAVRSSRGQGFVVRQRSAANRIGAALIVAGLLVSSALLARVHDLRSVAGVGFVLAFVLGLYMIWKIIRTPGEL
jgi:ABC-type enterobactin transport system permease subunit